MNLFINPELSIPYRELQWRFSRSSGAGGQNINKTDTKVELIFMIENSCVLNDYQKIKLRKNFGKNLINDSICIVSQEQRTQHRNRQIALQRMAKRINNALNEIKIFRVRTIPTLSSNLKRLEKKKQRGELKKSRRYNDKY